MARSLFSAGVRDTDVFGHLRLRPVHRLAWGSGCLSIPAEAGNSPRQIKLMRDFRTMAAHAIPSYLGRLLEVFKDEGLDPRQDTRLHTLVISAEPRSEEYSQRIEEMWQALRPI